MDANSELENQNFRVARMIYQTYTRFENCLDGIFRAHGLTTERYLVLLAIKNHDTPARIVDIARWGERSKQRQYYSRSHDKSWSAQEGKGQN